MDIVVPTLRFDALRVFTKARFADTAGVASCCAAGVCCSSATQQQCTCCQPRLFWRRSSGSWRRSVGECRGCSKQYTGEGLVPAAAGDATAAEADDSAILPGCIKTQFEGEHVAGKSRTVGTTFQQSA
jgi:hypothetical protein